MSEPLSAETLDLLRQMLAAEREVRTGPRPPLDLDAVRKILRDATHVTDLRVVVGVMLTEIERLRNPVVSRAGATDPLDLPAIAAEWLRECGPHDYGVDTVGCRCNTGDYRWVMAAHVREIRRLRSDLANLGYWDCANCGGSQPAGPVEDGAAQCAACGHRIDWREPDTLSSLRAERDAAREQLRAVRDVS